MSNNIFMLSSNKISHDDATMIWRQFKPNLKCTIPHLYDATQLLLQEVEAARGPSFHLTV